MDTSIIAAFVGVGVGWLLSQLTDFAKEKRQRDKKIGLEGVNSNFYKE